MSVSQDHYPAVQRHIVLQEVDDSICLTNRDTLERFNRSIAEHDAQLVAGRMVHTTKPTTAAKTANVNQGFMIRSLTHKLANV